MSDENNSKTVEQDYHYQVDQQVSVNAFIDVDVLGETVRFQVTNRYGATPEKIIKTTRAAIEAYIAMRQEFPRQVIQPPVPSEPSYHTVDDGGNELPKVKSFTAERLSVESVDGKHYYKVVGTPFTQYGVRVWDEVLEAAGVQVDHATGAITNITGWTAEYVEEFKNGKNIKKVTRLLRK
jgi:hypothetical protein